MIDVCETYTIKQYREKVSCLIRELMILRKMSMVSISKFLGITNVNLSNCYTGKQSLSGPAFYRLICFYSRELPEKNLNEVFRTTTLFDDAFPSIEF